MNDIIGNAIIDNSTILYWKGNQDSYGNVVNYGFNSNLIGKLIGTAKIISPWGNSILILKVKKF